MVLVEANIKHRHNRLSELAPPHPRLDPGNATLLRDEVIRQL